MNYRKTTIVIAGVLILILHSTKLPAQFDAMFTQYMNNEMFINPAYTGAKEALAVTMLHRQQWVGYNGRPVTTTFSVNTPLMLNKMGVGLCYLNEKIGVLSRNMIYASYAYRIRTYTKGYLSFGLMGGLHIQQNKVTDLHTSSPNDPRFSGEDIRVVTPNFGFGMYYNTDKFYAGFSVPRLLDDHARFTTEGILDNALHFKISSLHYYLTAGRLFKINRNIKLKPHMMMKVVLNAPVQFDINIDGLFLEKLWVGLSYRSGSDVCLLAGVQITPAFLLSYSYDCPTTSMNQYSGGSHEIVLAYIFAYRGKKINSPRYF